MESNSAKVTSPLIRTATRLCASIMSVVGIAFGRSEPLKPANSESSMKLGYGILNRLTNAAAAERLSRVTTPTN